MPRYNFSLTLGFRACKRARPLQSLETTRRWFMFWQRERKKLGVSMVVLPFFAAAALSVCFAGYEMVYIRCILSHAEYDEKEWQK
jgi:hypothetical protein